MLDEARKRSEGLDLPVEFHVGDAHRLDFSDNFFDACRTERVLQHLDDPQSAIAEMVRVTKPGGAVCAFEPDWGSLIVDLPDHGLARKIVGIFYDHLNRNPWIGRQLYRRFRQADLVDVTEEAFTLTLKDPALSRSIYNLDAAVTRGKELGLLSVAEIDAWSDQVSVAEANGHLLAAATAFVVVGRKSA
jgi:ubiquinone/menaquinone biosynthesis C-methylase UbiE